MQSKLLSEAVATLLKEAGFAVVNKPPPVLHADLAVWDLRDLHPPYPEPPEMPALAFVDSTEANKIMLLGMGYRGYLHGEESLSDLKRAIEVVLRGEVWAERSILSSLIMKTKTSSLTVREQQVLSLIVQGLSNKHIAQKLNISEKTVKVYVSGVLDKTGAKTRMDLVVNHKRMKSPL